MLNSTKNRAEGPSENKKPCRRFAGIFFKNNSFHQTMPKIVSEHHSIGPYVTQGYLPIVLGVMLNVERSIPSSIGVTSLQRGML